MNYLAHCFLSPPNSAALVGNLLGDFCKGVDESLLIPQIKQGLLNHRLVDKFTDAHPNVIAAKCLFSAQRRRFSGIALDVLFDHYLIKHWSLYSPISYLQFKQQTFEHISQGFHFMPAPMAHTMQRVISQDWFASYENLEGIGYALDRIANRIRFANQFDGCIEDIYQHESALEQCFLVFFPQLIAVVKDQNLISVN